MVTKQEKITITIPHDLKKEVVELKSKFKTSINSLIKKAIEEYVKKNEVEKWINGAKKASENISYKNDALSMDAGGEFYEY